MTNPIAKINWTKVLTVTRVLDLNGNISLSNIALVVALVRLFTIPNLTITDLGTFFVAIISYQVKRFAAPPAEPEDLTPIKESLAKLETKITAMQLSAQMTTRR